MKSAEAALNTSRWTTISMGLSEIHTSCTLRIDSVPTPVGRELFQSTGKKEFSRMAKKAVVRSKATSNSAKAKTKSVPKKRNPKHERKAKKRLASERFKSKSRFYRGTDISRPFDAVIANVTTETLGDDGDEKDVVWVEDHEKGIVLNQTMGLQLADDLGDDMDGWAGGTITVYTERVRNPSTGKIGPAVRVRGADTTDVEDDLDDDLEDDLDDDNFDLD